MRLPALLAIFTPWILLVIAWVFSNIDQPEAITILGNIWLGISPVFIAACIGIAYREGQWSKQNEQEISNDGNPERS